MIFKIINYFKNIFKNDFNHTENTFENLLDTQICDFCNRSRRNVGRLCRGPSFTPDNSNKLICFYCMFPGTEKNMPWDGK